MSGRHRRNYVHDRAQRNARTENDERKNLANRCKLRELRIALRGVARPRGEYRKGLYGRCEKLADARMVEGIDLAERIRLRPRGRFFSPIRIYALVAPQLQPGVTLWAAGSLRVSFFLVCRPPC